MLSPLTGLKDVGGLMRPGTEWAMPEAELHKLPGFGTDIDRNRAEAKRLLAEAGYPSGLNVVLKNRNVKLPYQDLAAFVIQEWRKIGVEADHRLLETAAWFNDGQNTGNFEAIVAPGVEYMDDPDQFLGRYVPGSTQNWGRFSDPRIDNLFARQPESSILTSARSSSRRSRRSFSKMRTTCRTLVDTERGALGKGEELRRPTGPAW